MTMNPPESGDFKVENIKNTVSIPLLKETIGIPKNIEVRGAT